jgi:hypothetical protein
MIRKFFMDFNVAKDPLVIYKWIFLVKSGKLGASLPLPPLRTVRVPFKTHQLKPPIAGPFVVVSSSHTISVSKTYADAPSGDIHDSTFLSSEDSQATTLCSYERPTRSQLPFGPIMGLSIRTIVSVQLYSFLLSRSLSR